MRRPLRIAAGEPELHCWCPVCLLPIRVRVPLHVGDTSTPPVGTLEICPGCGTGHDRPSIAISAPPRQPRIWHPLTGAARAVHQWASRRRGRTSRVCAHRDCRWPGLHRLEHSISSDEGTWRYVFCSKRHRRAWGTDHGITVTDDRGTVA